MPDKAANLLQLQALLPPGAAWPRDPDAELTKLLDPPATELARIDAFREELRRELDPRTTTELLSDWEATCELPSAGTLAERRDAVFAKVTERGGQSRPYFINLAAKLGFTITITNFAPHDDNANDAAPLYGTDWRFAFQINAPATTIREWTDISGDDEPLRTWGNQALEDAINEDKPAHTVALFTYG